MSNNTISSDSISTDDGQLVAFRLDEVEFGVNINSVKEIVRLPEITPIPQAPDYVAGICNLRGSVLPVINTRSRFNMNESKLNEENRLLVVETAGVQTGLIVDDVKEVMQVENDSVAPPPAVCKGIDREFLSGIVKIDEGKRLVLILDLKEVVNITVSESGSTSEGQTQTFNKNDTINGKNEEEEQLVTFKIASEEYAFSIESVREILRVTDITHVPNVPSYVKGLFTIRNQLMPVLELRTLLGVNDLGQEYIKEIDLLSDDCKKWVNEFRLAVENNSNFKGARNIRDSSYGKWSDSYNSSNSEVVAIVKELKTSFINMFRLADDVFMLAISDKVSALKMIDSNIEPLVHEIDNQYKKLKRVILTHITDDQRVMVVESGAMSVGYLVDMVNEVVRIPQSVIDQTPEMAKSDRKELRGIAKLKQGERLIMILDDTALVSKKDTVQILKAATEMAQNGKSKDMDSRSLAQQALDEEQLVTFSIGKEEYGIPVMQVQEINRLTEITSIPRAPEFIDGVTNLRGSVIPVINIRKFFGLTRKDRDDRTRVIIVDIGGVRTGMCVDQVNEVLRVSRANVVQTPSLITSTGANKYMDGVLKLNDGKRMIITLTIEKMLSDTEIAVLSSVEENNDIEDENDVPEETNNKSQNRKIGIKQSSEKKSNNKNKISE